MKTSIHYTHRNRSDDHIFYRRDQRRTLCRGIDPLELWTRSSPQNYRWDIGRWCDTLSKFDWLIPSDLQPKSLTIPQIQMNTLLKVAWNHPIQLYKEILPHSLFTFQEVRNQLVW